MKFVSNIHRKILGICLLIGAVALWTQAASATEVLYSFSGTGEGSPGRIDTSPQTYVFVTQASGYVSFDPSQATAFGNGQIYNFQSVGVVGTNSVYAEVQGDLLYIYARWTDLGYNRSSHFDRSFTLSALFNPGYLNGAFPTSIDFSQIISSNYSALYGSYYIHTDVLTSFGQLSSLSATSLNGRFGSDVSVISTGVPSVPEPATWALMLLGFGAIGVSLRRRRRTGDFRQVA